MASSKKIPSDILKKWWWRKGYKPKSQKWIFTDFEMPAAVFYECSRRKAPSKFPEHIRNKTWLELSDETKNLFATEIWPGFERDAVKVDFSLPLHVPWTSGEKPKLDNGWTPPAPIAINLKHKNNSILEDFKSHIDWLRKYYDPKSAISQGKVAKSLKFTAAEAHDKKIAKIVLTSTDHVAYHNYFGPAAKYKEKIELGIKKLQSYDLTDYS